jgi:hypothetical protein
MAAAASDKKLRGTLPVRQSAVQEFAGFSLRALTTLVCSQIRKSQPCVSVDELGGDTHHDGAAPLDPEVPEAFLLQDSRDDGGRG